MGFLTPAENGAGHARTISWAVLILLSIAATFFYMSNDMQHSVEETVREEPMAAYEPPTPLPPPAIPPVRQTITRRALPVARPPAQPVVPQPPAQRHTATKLSPDALFRRTSPAVVQVVATMKDSPAVSQGSGFFVSDDGLVVTNYHCIQGAKDARIVTADGDRKVVEGVLAHNAKADLALLKVSGRVKAHLSLADDRPPRVGTRVFAIGNPKGLTNTLSDGMISGLRAMAGEVHFLQTTAPISHGSSGGPLLTDDGKVVGVTTATYADGQNLNLAVPAAEVRKLIDGQGRLQSVANVSGQRVEPAPAILKDAARTALLVKRDLKTAGPLIDKLIAAHRSDPYVWYLSAIRWEMRAAKAKDEDLLDRAYDDYRQTYKLDPDSDLGRAADQRMYELRTR